MTSNGSAASTRVLQVSNISPSASKDQLYSLFAFLGRIDEYRMYPSDGSQSVQKFAYFKFDRASSVELGQHLTNTVFIDRALVCVPAPTSEHDPHEETALRTGPILPGQRQLPPNVVTSKQADADGQEMLYTNDPQMAALGLPPYPPLPVGTEPSKVEEIRRTVYIGGLKKGTNGQDLINFLNATIGEVMYLRMTAENEHLPCSYAYVEFSSQSSVPLALQNNGIEFDGVPLKIQHSKVAIVKPQQKTADQALEEVEEAIRHNEGRLDPPAIVRGHSPAHSSRSGSRRRSPSPPPRRRSPSAAAAPPGLPRLLARPPKSRPHAGAIAALLAGPRTFASPPSQPLAFAAASLEGAQVEAGGPAGGQIVQTLQIRPPPQSIADAQRRRR
ncbi:hypothetical protein M3Y99_00359200 [Aphelenchoides fujianensis]|nr:hypothetical protein M3Y99_00359200 [Aphelenchoides fujianensis]